MTLSKRLAFATALLFAFLQHSFAQVPGQATSADIFLKIKKLNVLGSVLYVAAHPDDENNALLPYLAKERMYRTAYLSLTRGDGGQNLIGSEQGVELGMIRTQELLAARKQDGAEQYFSSAYEFGFSKNANEALRIWDKDRVLGDIVWTIRKFQPDIIITRFPGDARAGHGHHWASALLANEAYLAAADSTRYPEQLKLGVRTWKAKRILWNGFNFGGVNTTTGMPIRLDIGGFDPLLGKSSGEIGGEARSMHKSQGEGRPRRRGEIIENFVTTGGDTAKSDIMDDVVTDWNRVEDGYEVKAKINKIIRDYNFEHPENSIEELCNLYYTVSRLNTAAMVKQDRDANNGGFLAVDNVWWQKKLAEIRDIIVDCSGLFLEATTKEQFALAGDTAVVTCAINSRTNLPVKLNELYIFKGGQNVEPLKLVQNQNYNYDIKVPLSGPGVFSLRNATQPYWLQLPQTPGNFTIPDPLMIGEAWNQPFLTATFTFEINGFVFPVTRPVQYKYVDPVKGEVYQPFIQVPHIYFSLAPHVALMNVRSETGKLQSTDSVFIRYKSNFTQQNVPTSVFMLEDVVKPVFEKQDRNFEKGKQYTIAVPVKQFYNPANGEYMEAAVKLNLNGRDRMFTEYFKGISYDHIPDIYYSFKDRIRFVNEEVKTTGKKIGYIPGAGDRMQEALKEMHYDVKVLSESDLTESNLQQFDAIVIGVRAHNIFEYLSEKNEVLNNYVKNGGNLIAQYIKSNTVGNKPLKLSPYPFTISTGSRVTDENAEVNFLLPQHPVLNYPNKITSKDFEGWIQERSTYQVDRADPHFEMPLGMNDPGEKQSNGSLAIAKYGKGNFAYVSLVLFRQLPAGVAGSYRILANLIALPKNN